MDRAVWPPQQQHRRGHSMGSGVREKDEELALFKNMGKRSDQTTFLYPGTGTDDQLIDATLSTKFGGLSHPHSAPPVQRNGIGAELLNSDADKTDYDWLMTPPGTPLFPSLDADSPVLQQGMIMSRSLAAIKTSRANTGTRADSSAVKTNRGNPSPSRRSSTPQSGQSSASAAMRSNNHVPAKTASNNRPATPTRSSTPTSIRASPNPRPSTPTRQNSAPAPARSVTPMGARPAAPTRRPATPTSSGRPSSTPTLRRSSSSPPGSQAAHGGISARGNPSPTRSTASTGTSALRGASPVRSTSSRGVSPVRGVSPAPSARGVSPAPSARGRSPSPSLRAPYPVEASDDIPPNLRTTSDRPSSAQRRPVAYGANPGEVPVRSGSPTPPQRRTASPARSTARSSSSVGQHVDKLSRAVLSDVDSEGSFDTCSQSGISSHGILTPEKSGSGRRMSYGRGSCDDYGRSSSLQKAKRGSTTSPQFAGPLTSKKFFESAAREYHRGQVAAFRPLMTNSSISTFYSSRASGLLRRPLTPSSTASSSEHGATVAHDSEVDDEEAGSDWKPLSGQAHEAHSPLHLFDKSLSSSLGPGPLDGTSIADNEEMSNFFKDSELALEVESQLEQPATTAEINRLSRNEPEDTEYVWSRDGTDGESHPAFDGLRNNSSGQDQTGVSRASLEDGVGAINGSLQGSSGLEKIRDKLRYLKSTAENEDGDSASPAPQIKPLPSASAADPPCAPSLVAITSDSFADGGSLPSTATEALQGICDICGFRRYQAAHSETSERPGCHCGAKWVNGIPASGLSQLAGSMSTHCGTSQPFQALEGVSSRQPNAEGSSTKVEKTEPVSRAANMVYGKEQDIWYIYRHSSEREVPAAGVSEEKTEVHPSKVLGKDAHIRASPSRHHDIGRGRDFSPTAVSAQQESTNLGREDTIPSMVDHASAGESRNVKGASSNAQKDDVTLETVSKEVCRDAHWSSRAGAVRHVAAEVALKGKALRDEGTMFGSPPETSQHADTRSESIPESESSEGSGYELASQNQLEQVYGGPERVHQRAVAYQCDKETRQAGIADDEPCKSFQTNHTSSENPQAPALHSSSVPNRANVVNPMSPIPGAEKRSEVSVQPIRRDTGHVQPGGIHMGVEASEVFTVDRSHHVAVVSKDHRNMHSVEPCQISQEEKRLPVDHMKIPHDGLPSHTTGSCAKVNENENTHSLVTTSDVSASQIEELQSKARIGVAAGASIDSKADDRERRAISRERDEDAFIDIQVDPCGKVTVKLGDPEVIRKHSTDTGLVSESLPAGSVFSAGEKLILLSHQEQDSIDFETQILENMRPPEPDVWNSLKLPHSTHQPDFETREADKKKERSELTSIAKPFRKFGNGIQPGSLSKSSSSKSSFRTPTSGGSIDLSRSTDTTSSCPSNASWEDPQYIGSKVWDSRSASDVARVSDVSEPAPLTTSFEEKDLCVKGVGHAVKAGGLASQNGEMQRSNPEVIAHNVSTFPLDEASEEHFDYVFECLGSKRDPSAKPAELPVVSRVVAATTLQDYSVDPDKGRNGSFSGNTTGIHFTVEKNGVAKVSGNHAHMSTLSKSQNIPDRAKNSGVPDASSSPNAKVLATRPSAKEEIVESTVSPGSSTPKHMSSFKFSHKKSDKSELKRSNTSRQATEGWKSQQSDAAAIPSRKSNSKASEKSAAATPPHVNKEKPMRAASPPRPLPANAKVPGQVTGANGEAPEELSIHSRFSNITVRSGSDTENFDWGRSSLEEASSRCGSSSGSNTASVAILKTTPAAAALRDEHDATGPSSGREDEESEHPQPNKFSPSRRSAEIQLEASPNFEDPDPNGSGRFLLKHSAPDCRNPMEAHTLEPGGWPKLEDPSDPKHGPETAVVHPLRPMRASLNHAPKQNLDKLSEKLEQLETFGARVVLRDPQQQLMHSPPADRRPPADGDKRDPDRSTHSRRLEKLSSKQSKCRCTIM